MLSNTIEWTIENVEIMLGKRNLKHCQQKAYNSRKMNNEGNEAILYPQNSFSLHAKLHNIQHKD